MVKKRKSSGHLFPTAAEDKERARKEEAAKFAREQINSSAYRLAFDDMEFLLREEMRPVRLLLELTKPEFVLQEHNIGQTVVIFGGARMSDKETAQARYQEAEKAQRERPGDPDLERRLLKARRELHHADYYELSRRLAAVITERSGRDEVCPKLHVVTGGGPGIMEAANRGALDVNGKSVGLNIVLPHEQYPNPYITPELCFLFHYFAMRKMHFLLRAMALVVFPGGYGTLDELFEALTLVQTRKIKPLPILIFGREYWEKVINFDHMVEEGMISPEDVDIFRYVESVEEAWEIIRQRMADLAAENNTSLNEP